MNENDKSRVYLKGLSPKHEGMEFSIKKDEFTIGRSPQNDVVLPGGTISAQHSKISSKEGIWEIRDMNSTNGTFVNGEQIMNVRLRTGDIIAVDTVEFKFINDADVERTIVSAAKSGKEIEKTSVQQPSDSPYATNKEFPKKMKPAAPDRKEKISLPVGWNRIFLAMILLFLFTVIIPFFASLTRLPTVNVRFSGTVFAGLLRSWPQCFLPSHWIRMFSTDTLTLIIFACTLLGLCCSGILLASDRDSSRWKNIFTFSGFLSFITVIVSIILSNFRLQNIPQILGSGNTGVPSVILNVSVVVGSIFVTSLITAYSGSLLVRSE